VERVSDVLRRYLYTFGNRSAGDCQRHYLHVQARGQLITTRVNCFGPVQVVRSPLDRVSSRSVHGPSLRDRRAALYKNACRPPNAVGTETRLALDKSAANTLYEWRRLSAVSEPAQEINYVPRWVMRATSMMSFTL